MISASKILDVLSNEVPTELKTLEKLLKVTKKADKGQLNIALTALKKLDILDIDESNHIRSIASPINVKARIRCSSKGYCFAVREGSDDDIYIRDHHLNNAWHGDNVIVKLTKEGVKRRSPEGIIQCILDRNTTNVISVLFKEDDNLIAVPLDDRILSHIELEKRDLEYYSEELEQNIVEIKVTKYPIGQIYASGQVIRKLPLDGGMKGDLDIVLTKSNLQNDIESPRISLKEPYNKQRLDLTSQPSLLLQSWEHKDAPNLPALHIVPEDGGMKVWLHSQAVSERFNHGTKIDNWLSDRSEAICLGNQWRPLLSKQLKEASSFEINKENDAVSICMSINKEGELKSWNFHLTKIKPVAVINPKHLESINKRTQRSRTIPQSLKTIKEYITQIESILYCAKQINECGNKNSTIQLNLPIPKLEQLSEMLWEYPGRSFYGWKNSLNTNDPQSILNLFVDLANRCWYEHSISLKIPTISTYKEEIEENNLNDVIKASLSLNMNLKLNEDGLLDTNELLNQFKENPNEPLLHKLVKNIIKDKKLRTSLCTEDLLDTKYNNEEFDSPWCCPTLNYLDIINQNLLVMLLRDGKCKENNRSKLLLDLGLKDISDQLGWPLFSKSILDHIQSIVNNKTVNNFNKKRIQTKSLKNNIRSIVISREAEKIVGKDVEATITGVQSYGFFAEIPPLMIDGLVHVSSLQDDWYEYRSRQNLLIGRKNKRTYQLGDKVIVKINKVDVLKNQIDLDVINSNNNVISNVSESKQSNDKD